MYVVSAFSFTGLSSTSSNLPSSYHSVYCSAHHWNCALFYKSPYIAAFPSLKNKRFSLANTFIPASPAEQQENSLQK